MYHQIARNKRKSVFVIAGFFIIWAAIGYLIGFIAGGVGGGVAGIIIAAIAALLVVLWSVTSRRAVRSCPLGRATGDAAAGAGPL